MAGGVPAQDNRKTGASAGDRGNATHRCDSLKQGTCDCSVLPAVAGSIVWRKAAQSVRWLSPRLAFAVAVLAAGLEIGAGCGASSSIPQPSIRADHGFLTNTRGQSAGGGSAAAGAPEIAATPISSDTGTAQDAESSPISNSSPAPTQAPSATPIAKTPLEQVDALALGGGTQVRSKPSMADGETVATLSDRQPIVILREVRGQRWVVGDQTWAMAIQDWSNLWYQINGGYVYAGFVYIPRQGELDTLANNSGARSIDVDLNTQTARAMIGDQVVHTAPVTTGKPGFATPAGNFQLESWGRKLNETMTSSQAGIQDPHEQYDVHNVLYTQYFDAEGDALHLNYWQPESVFGRQRTSHGCVGMVLHDAQFLWLFAKAGTRLSIHPAPASPTPTTTITATPAPTAAARAAASPTSTASPTAVPLSPEPAKSPTPVPTEWAPLR